jgi:hypothetical protein
LQATYVKQVEKLELHVHEYTLKVEELNRTIIDITSHKTRLSTVRLQRKRLFKKEKILRNIFIDRKTLN